MSLEVAPEIEKSLREYAEAEGISINDLLARHFPKQRVAETDPVLQFLNQRLQQAQTASLTEDSQSDAEWQSFRRNTNDSRRSNGEHLLYPEEPQE